MTDRDKLTLAQALSKALQTVDALSRSYERGVIQRVMAVPAVDGRIKMADVRKAVRGG